MIIFYYLYDKFFKLYFTTEHVKIVKIPGFFSDFYSNFRVFFKLSQILGYFCLNCRIPGFTRFPGKVATLYDAEKHIVSKTISD